MDDDSLGKWEKEEMEKRRRVGWLGTKMLIKREFGEGKNAAYFQKIRQEGENKFRKKLNGYLLMDNHQRGGGGGGGGGDDQEICGR
jgi:hypothetical protein